MIDEQRRINDLMEIVEIQKKTIIHFQSMAADLRDVVKDQQGIIDRLKIENLGLHRHLRQVQTSPKWTVTLDEMKSDGALEAQKETK